MFTFTKIQEIAHRIAPGDLLAFGYIHSGFHTLFEELSGHLEVEDVDVFILTVLRYKKEDIFQLDRISSQFNGKFLVTQVAPDFASTPENGKVDILPLPLSQVPQYFKEQSKRRNVWVFAEISPPDNKGFCNTGYSAPFPVSLFENCNAVGLVNEKMPVTYGDTAIPAHHFDYFVKIPDKLPLFPEPEISDITRAIGQHTAQLIDDEATVEGGIGEIVNSVLAELTEKKRLKFQSGLLPEEVRPLVEKGVIVGRSVANVTGARSEAFYDWIRLNPAVEIRTMEYTHDISRIANQPDFTALGSALAVDLFGQVVSETIGTKQITGIGGALDFARSAKQGGGKSIIALASTYGKNNLSKIIPYFEKGEIISLTRYDVDYIVTEYGIAELRHQSRRARTLNLIRVAHPDHRDWLTEKAQQIGIL